MVKCGKCKGKHSNAAAVRQCYQGQTVGVSFVGSGRVTGRIPTPQYAKANVRSLGAEGAKTVVKAPAVRLATDNQIDYVADLIFKLSGAVKSVIVESLTTSRDDGKLTFSDASTTIDELKARLAEKAQREAIEAPTPTPVPMGSTTKGGVPDGRYAIRRDDITKFYKVNTPTEGRWAGYTFVEVQASDETWPIKNRNDRNDILAAIARDVRGALQLYGQELGHCGHCGRTLTDETSRAFGIGPVCREKLGY